MGQPFMYDGVMMPPMPGLFPDTEKKLKAKSEMEVRDTDIFLCSYPKAGTNWTHEILSMVISNSTDYNQHSPIDTMLEAQPDMAKFDSMTSRRLFITHLPYRYLPREVHQGKGKVVFVNRNPKDLHVSMFNFSKGKGMFPEDMTWSQYFEKGVVGNMKMLGGWFQYSKDWEQEFNKDNILPVYYEDMKQNIGENILKISEFLDVSCTKEFANEIGEKCSFDKLKNNKIDYTALLDKRKKSTLFRKGQVGDWKNWFSVAQNEAFDAYYSVQMKDSNLKFTYEL